MQPLYASSSLTREELLRNLKESKLLPAEGLPALIASAPGTAENDGASVARSLIASGVLTAYQMEAISERRFSDLRVGGYEVLDRVGVGGMGTVYKARHRRMKRIVAVKVLQSSLCLDLSFIKRFQREVETVARLTHPNVVMAFDAGEAEGCHFLVMEYVNGSDLATNVQKQGPFSVPRAVNIILQAARGLDYAHSQQVIHRDIKPANLLLDENGVVKVADLGLARFNIDRPTGSSLTAAGVILGTADYMSPEQALDCVSVDHRADIYSLGCTLYFLLTGQPVYQADSLMALLLKHREAPIPSPRALKPAVSVALDDLFRKMVAKSPDDRHQSMSEVVTGLEAIAATLDPPGIAASTVPNLTAPNEAASLAPSRARVGAPRPGDPPPSPTRVLAPAAPAPSTPKLAITALLVEPSRTQAVIIRKYLQDAGIEPLDVVSSGQEALVAIRSALPHVIVSALHLKDMTGVELARQTLAAHGNQAPGFLLISSEAEKQDIGSLSAVGQVAILHKPFTFDQLRTGILQMATRHEAPVPARSAAHDETMCKTGNSGTQPLGRSPAVARREELNVLLANDGGAARARMRQVLQAQGFAKFVEVADGPQGVAAVSRDTYDLVVVEDNMPSLDVAALIDYLRQNGRATLPILLVTTETNSTALEALEQKGVAVLRDPSFPAHAVKPIIDRFFP